MIWNNATIRYRVILAVIAVAVTSILMHNAYNSSDSSKLSRTVHASVACAGPVTDAMPGLDNAATAIAPALVAGTGYVMHTRHVSHRQIDAALAQLESKQNPESSALELKGVTAEQSARLMATKEPLDDALEPMIDCSEAMRAVTKPRG